jgi:hypothetical protein
MAILLPTANCNKLQLQQVAPTSASLRIGVQATKRFAEKSEPQTKIKIK